MEAIVKEEQWTRCLVDQDGVTGTATEVRTAAVLPWTLHVRAIGRTWRLAGESLGLDLGAPDKLLLAQVASALKLPPGCLDGNAVDRAPNIVMVRPWAIWG
jgi:hypothetical protein